MATINIFASIDVNGLIDQYKNDLQVYYGVDVTAKYMSEQLETVLLQIKNGQKALCKIGYYDTAILPSFTRLISAKSSTIGYKVGPGDYSWIDQSKGELRLNNIYNLMISAHSGDNIVWWGHSIKANSHIEVIISDIHKPRQSSRPDEFKNFGRRNIQFFYASSAVDPNNLLNGVQVSTEQVYCIQCDLNGASGSTVSYDIDLMLLSISFSYQGSLISVPIAQIVVDSTIVIS
jgi:hypothetical protein